jgi:hypothetical protein
MQRFRKDVSFASSLITIGAALIAAWSHLPHSIPSAVFVGLGITVMTVKGLWLPALFIVGCGSQKKWAWTVLATALTAGLAYGGFEMWYALIPAHLAEGILCAYGVTALALMTWYGADKLGGWLFERYSAQSA